MPKKKKLQPKLPTEETANGITGITIAGFKSIRDEQTIEIRPLTILAGANSSGKSSIMQPLLLMKQTLEAQFDPGPLLLDGPLLKFNLVREMLSQPLSSTSEPQLRVGITSDAGLPGWTLTTLFQKLSRGDGLEISEMTIAFPGTQPASIRPQTEPPEFASAITNAYKEFLVTETKGSPELIARLVPRASRRRCFLSLELVLPKYDEHAPFVLPINYSADFFIEKYLLELMYLPGLRGTPERAYPRASVGPRSPGVFTAYVAALVAKWQAENDIKLSRVGTLLDNLGLTWKVEALFPDDAHIALYIPRHRLGGKTSDDGFVNIADVGLGVSQALPVVVALVAADPGQMVYIEQPELHLHPRAQVAMAEVLADAAKRGVRVVAETHSSLLLLGIQTLVAEGKLSPDLVKFHWFTRDDEGFTRIDSTNLDSEGRFEQDWPQDFGDVELALQRRYLDAG